MNASSASRESAAARDGADELRGTGGGVRGVEADGHACEHPQEL